MRNLFCPLLLIVGLGLRSTSVASTVDVYPLASCFTQATSSYGVKANGITIPVRIYKPHTNLLVQYYYAHCGISGGSVTFVVDAKEAISTYTISPQAYNISATPSGSNLTFSVSSSKYLEIKINSKPTLCLLVDASEVNPPSPSGASIYNIVTQFGADSNGVSSATTKIQGAINAAYTNGGGTVYFPSGVYLSTALTLKSNVWLYFAPGSVLQAQLPKTSWAHPTSVNKFIDASFTSNVKIFGRGTISCRGCILNDDVPTNNTNQCQIKPIYADGVNGFTLDGIILNESTGWTVDLRRQSQNITISNLKVLNELTWEWNDGIDIVGSHDATVNHCFVLTCDDAACVKAIDYPVYNVTYNDVVADSGHASGFKVGNQAEADIYNITASNFNVISCHRGFNLDHWYGIGNWHDIHFLDWRVEKVIGTGWTINNKGAYYDVPFRIEIGDIASGVYDEGVGPISFVEVTRVTFDHYGPSPSYLWGEDNANNINKVCFTKLKMNGSYVTGYTTNLLNKGFTSNITWNTNSNPVTFEGESLTVTNSGCTGGITSDTNYSGGAALKIDSNSIGDYTEVTLPSVPAGSYSHVWIYYKSLADRGKYQASIDSTNQGVVQDQYGATQQFGLMNDLGPKTFYVTGNKQLRLTVTNKNSNSSGYTMMIDKVVLSP